DGSLFVFGCNAFGQLGLGTVVGNHAIPMPCQIVKSFNPINLLWNSFCKKNNHIFGWGRADYGQLGLGDDIVKQGYACQPNRISSLDGVTQMMCGAEHNIALLDNGKVLTWGWNEHGICGSEDEQNVHKPRFVHEERDVALVGCGGGHTFILLKSR
ncbi:hypothetical protein QZH41_017963, partial [Actinostola sp. cb2023]